MSWKASAYIKDMSISPSGQLLTLPEKFLALILADYHQDGIKYTFPSLATLAKDALMDGQRCRRTLVSLESKGVVLRVRPPIQYRGLTTFYSFPELDEKGGTSDTLPAKKGYPEGYQKGGTSDTLPASKKAWKGIGRVSEGYQIGPPYIEELELRTKEQIQLQKRTKTKTSAQPSVEGHAAASPSPANAIEIIPLNQGEYAILEAELVRDRELYPGIDVRATYRQIRAWVLANPTRRKTRRGVQRFLNTWLSKAQNESGGNTHGAIRQDKPRDTQRFEQGREELYKSLTNDPATADWFAEISAKPNESGSRRNDGRDAPYTVLKGTL